MTEISVWERNQSKTNDSIRSDFHFSALLFACQLAPQVLADPLLMMVSDVLLSRLHFTRYNMSAPWRLCLANNYLCPTQVKWHVSEDGSPTSDLSERLLCPGRHHALIFRGSHLFSLYQCVSIQVANPALVIRLSEAAEGEQRRPGFHHAYYVLNYCHFSWEICLRNTRVITKAAVWLKWMHSSGGWWLSTPGAGCFENVRVLIKKRYTQL